MAGIVLKGSASRGPGVVAGIGFAAAAFALFTVMDTLIKWLSGGYPLAQIVFFMALFSIVPTSLIVVRAGGLSALRTRRLPGHLLRAGIGLASSFCSFVAYSRLPLADAYAIAFSAPLFITALSVPLLGESVGWRRWTAVAVGFVGVMVMLRPGSGGLGLGVLAALLGAVGYASSVILVRRLSRTETTAALMFYANLVALSVTGAMLPFEFVMPDGRDMILLAGVGLTGGCAQILLISGFRYAPAVVVAPFQYTQLLWGALYGFLIWGDVPNRWMLFGAPIVMASGLYILYRETRNVNAAPVASEGAPGVGAPLVAESAD